MGEKNWGCVKQTAAGCGCLVVAAVAIPLVMAVMIMVPMNRAVEARSDLESMYGTQGAFIPPPSGVPAPDRLTAFLEVRRTTMGTCEDFWRAERAVADLEAMDDHVEVSKVAAVKQVMTTSKTMMGMGSLIGHFFETRNQALLDNGMGLGEYTYIYLLAYRDEILEPSIRLQLFGPGSTNRRVRRALRSMLQNQLRELSAEDASEVALATLAAEVEALENDSKRIPWQDGIPPAIAESLLPFREELDALFCGATSPLELMINEKRAMAIETR